MVIIVKPQLSIDLDGIIRMAKTWSWWEGSREDKNLPEMKVDGVWHLVCPNRGLTLYLTEPDGQSFKDLEDGGCADACDRFLQFACFGEVLYG